MRRCTDHHAAARRAAVGVAATLLLLAGCGGQDTADRVIEANTVTSTTAGPPTTSPTTVEVPASTTTTTATTLPPLGPGQQELWVFDLEVGDCFNERIRSQDGTEVETIVKVACDEPHDNEVFDELVFPQVADAPYPGHSELTAYADGQCLDAFEGFVGISYVLSELEIGTVVPTLDSWIEGDRDLTCVLYDVGGEPLESSMAGAER